MTTCSAQGYKFIHLWLAQILQRFTILMLPRQPVLSLHTNQSINVAKKADALNWIANLELRTRRLNAEYKESNKNV
jgi:hypothetical protein